MLRSARSIRDVAFRALPGALLLTLAACAGTVAPAPEAVPAPAPAPEVQAPPEPEAPPAPVFVGVDLDTIHAGPFDNGKMWTFDFPPVEYLQEEYGFQADSAWFVGARLGALRIPGCTASFVSPNGLVMTNHHCAREAINQVSREGEDLVESGFYARSLEEERPIEDTWAEQLVEIRDVTDEVEAALEGVEGSRARTQRRQQIQDEISKRIAEELGGEDAGIKVQIISLYQGARYSAYVFRRYTDVRLVMSPEVKVAYFGGDWDNFTYPRYDLDVSFYRVYGEDGKPLRTEHYFPFDPEGVSEGDLVFVIGNPGGTTRLQTVAQLEFRRDFREPAILRLFTTRADILEAFAREEPETAREMDLRNRIFGIRNAEKNYRGRVKGLRDPVIMARRQDQERTFQAAIDADPELRARFGDLISRMAEIQERKRTVGREFGAFLAFGNPNFESATLVRAFLAYQYLGMQEGGAPEQALSGIRERLLGVKDQPRGLDERLMIQRFEDVVHYLGEESAVATDLLEGRTPEGLAAVVFEGTVLADSAATAAALDGGTLTREDPAIRVVRALLPAFQNFQRVMAEVGAEEQEIANRIGQARFAVYGTAVPPDATFSLRIADGVVKGYEYNGTVAPVYTTFYGLYDHYYSYGAGSDWDLPERWLRPPEGFDLSTPLNFVSTADIIGGNSGSPVIDRDLHVVGLIFDGNIESLPGDYIYLPERNRAVAVDVRGILEALDEIYDADRLVLEVTEGILAPTEEEADARRGG